VQLVKPRIVLSCVYFGVLKLRYRIINRTHLKEKIARINLPGN